MTITAHDALDEYEVFRCRRVSVNTWAGEKPGLLSLVDHCLRMGVTLDELTPLQLDDWFYSQGLSDATLHTRLSQLRGFLSYCVDVRHWLRDDPSLLLTAAKPWPRERERLEPAELLQLLDNADFPQHRVVLALAMNLALRGGEIQGLRIADWTGDRLHVRVYKSRLVDDMPVTRELRQELTAWVDEYRENANRPLARSDWLVPSQYVSTIQRRVTYRPDRGSIGDPEDVVKRALTAVGWDTVKGEGIHTVRRSVARIFYDAAVAENGENDALLATMRLLHHTKPTTTLEYIGVDKQTEERDKVLLGRSFLPRLAGVASLSIAQ